MKKIGMTTVLIYVCVCMVACKSSLRTNTASAVQFPTHEPSLDRFPQHLLYFPTENTLYSSLMETRRNGSLEISMHMPPDDEQRSGESSSNTHPFKFYRIDTKISKSDAKHKEIEAYKNLSTLLWRTEQKIEKKVIAEVLIFLCFGALITYASTVRLDYSNFFDWKSFFGYVSIFCGLSIIRVGTYIILRYMIEVKFKFHKNVVFFARGLKTSVNIFLWLSFILISWLPPLSHYSKYWANTKEDKMVFDRIIESLVAIFVGSIFWVLKNTLLLKLESDLQLNRFVDRIKYAILHLHGVQMIDNRGKWSFGGIKEREKLLENVDRMKKGVPTWILKSLVTRFEKSMEEQRLPHVKDEFCDDKVLIDTAGSELLRKIVDDPHHQQDNRKGISQDDIKTQLQLTNKEAQVLTRLLVFEKEKTLLHKHSNQIEHNTLKIWVMHAYRSCWSLRRSLCNSREAISQLNKLLTSFLVIVVTIIWLLVAQIATKSNLALIFTPFIAFGFIIGDSCKAMFGGIIFAFVMHPFEVDDRCIIDDNQMKVNRKNILTTEMWKYDNGESIIYPNSVLATKKIGKFRGTRNQEDILQFDIDATTQWETIEALRAKIKLYFHENPHLCSEAEVVMENFGKIAVHFMYLVSYPDSKEKAKWRSELFFAIRKILQELDINPGS